MSNKKDLEIHNILRKDLPSVIDDIAEMESTAPEHLDTALGVLEWWFFNNPLGEGIFAGAFTKSKLVGIAGITPKRFIVNGKPVMGAEIGRTITHPDSRGMGVFSSLVRYLLKAASERGYHIVYGTPNQQSGRIYLGRLNFISLFHWDRLVRPVNWAHFGSLAWMPGRVVASAFGSTYNLLFPLRLGDYQYSVDDHIQPDLKTLIAQACHDSKCFIDRTPDYMQWRFDPPDREHLQVYVRDKSGELRGWAAGRYITASDIRFTRVHVGDFWINPQDRSVLKALMTAIMIEGQKRGGDMIYAVSTTKETSNSFRSLGFFRRPSIMPVIAFAPTGYDLKKIQQWEYRDSDADMF